MNNIKERPRISAKISEPHHKMNNLRNHNSNLSPKSQQEPPFPLFKDIFLIALVKALGKEEIPANRYRLRNRVWTQVAPSGKGGVI